MSQPAHELIPRPLDVRPRSEMGKTRDDAREARPRNAELVGGPASGSAGAGGGLHQTSQKSMPDGDERDRSAVEVHRRRGSERVIPRRSAAFVPAVGFVTEVALHEGQALQHLRLGF